MINIKNNKKGISIIVATLLLLSVTVFSVVFFQNWYTSFSSKTAANFEKDFSNNNLKSKMDLIGNTLYFKNDFPQINISEIKLNDISCINQSVLINNREIFPIQILDSCLNFSEDIYSEIIVYTDKGIFFKKVFIPKFNENFNLEDPEDPEEPPEEPGFDDTIPVYTDKFVSVWDTTKTSTGSSNSTQIRLPLDSIGSYNFIVSWGDGTNDTITAYDQAEVTHNYASAGIYQINITGELEGFRFNNGGDRLKISEISQWGELRLGSRWGAFFYGCNNLVVSANDTLNLSGTTTLNGLFRVSSTTNNFNITGNINHWDTSKITRMEHLFWNAVNFNKNIGNWNTSKVTSMRFMFNQNWNFNQDISNWDTSKVTNMAYMFNNNYVFNQNIGNWNTSSVQNISWMFLNADSFNQNLNSWDLKNVIDIEGIFNDADSFNGNISNWYFPKVKNIAYFFGDTNSFNQDLNSWNTSNITNMEYLFSGANSFNGDISNWDTSNVINMEGVFYEAVFNRNISNWDTSSVTNMESAFYNASSFNGNISNWNTSSVTNMNYLFAESTVFNQDLYWNTSNLLSMDWMFVGANSFNGNIENWDTSKVTTMEGALSYISSFNRDISNWNVSSVTNMDYLFAESTAFNQDLSSWCVQNIPSEPDYFDDDAVSWVLDRPNWGGVCS